MIPLFCVMEGSPMDPITSLQNERIKLAKGLLIRPRLRRKERKIALEGTRLVRDAVERGQKPLFVLYEPEKADAPLIALLEQRGAQLLPVSDAVMKHVSETQQPQGVVAVFPLPVPALPRHPRRVLILDGVSDPGNLGTALRTSAAAGVEVVLLAPGCVDPYNPKALRSGMGAHFRVPVIEAGWTEIGAYCQPLTVYLAAGDGDMRYDLADWSAPWAIIIGSEAHGTGPQAAALAQHRVYIPMAASTESLNAAAAAAVLLFETARTRL